MAKTNEDAELELQREFLEKHPGITIGDTMRRVMELEKAVVEVRDCLSQMVRAIEGEMGMERWSRPDPTAMLMDIYARLAEPCSILDKVKS